MPFKTVARTTEVPEGKVKAFEVEGHAVVIANQAGTFFATQDLCTHDDGPLGDGELWDGEIECPRHGGRFDIRTGKVTALPPLIPIRIYPVRIQGDEIQVDL